MLFDIPAEQASEAIERIAEEALWEAGVAGPPVDAFAVARRRGATVAEDAGSPHRARRVAFGSRLAAGRDELILLAPEPRAERRQWAVAHEIGESLAWRVFDELCVSAVDAPANAREWIANRFAGALLLPRAWFVDSLVDFDADLFALKSRFATASHELIARRWGEKIDAPVLVTVFDQGAITWRRANFGGGRPALTREEQSVWRSAHEGGRVAEFEPVLYSDSSLFSRVRCWPVHEEGWLREISLAELREVG